MASLRPFFIILLLASAVRPFKDDDDVNRLSLVMRPDDVLKVDVSRLISFKSSSVNFFSNNPAARLPGFSKKPPPVFETDRKFAPVILKSRKGRLFVVEEDRARLLAWDLVGKSELRPLAHNYAFERLPDIKLVIADLHLEADSLTVLFYDAAEHANPSAVPRPAKYYLFNVDIWDSSAQKIVAFTAPWAARPTLKLFGPHPGAGSRAFVFLLFDKESPTGTDFGPQRTVTLVPVDFAAAADQVPPSATVSLSVGRLLFGGESTDFRLNNVLTSTQPSHAVYFVVQDKPAAALRRHRVFSCAVNLPADPHKAEVSACEAVRPVPVKHFFLKGPNFVVVNDDNKMEFCRRGESCRFGTVQESWLMHSVLLEGDFAVVVMAIQGTKFVFVSDFAAGTLVWFYDDSPLLPAFLLFGSVRDTPRQFLAEVPDRGLAFRDVTFYPFFKIRGSQLRQDLLTNVYLEDRLVLSYDLRPLGDQRVKNLQEDRVVSVLTEPKTGEFRTKIDVVGSNLRFPENSLARVKYFNPMAFQIKWAAGSLLDQPYFLHREWLFFERTAVKLACAANKETYVYYCEEVGKFPLAAPLRLADLTTAEDLGDLVVLLADNSAAVAAFDTVRGVLLDLQSHPRFPGGRACMAFDQYLACTYPAKATVPVESLRVFLLRGGTLEEVPRFEELFLASLEQFVRRGEVPSERLASIAVSSFDFDNVQTDRLAVLLILAFEDNSTRAVYANYLFHFNPNLKADPRVVLLWNGRSTRFEREAELTQGTRMVVLDSQTLFYRFRNRFDLFCYDGDSRYGFEYLDATELVSVRVVNSHSLVVVVFRGHQDRHFFAVFRITQNAAKQLLRLEEIPGFAPGHTIAVLPVDDSTVAFHQYNPRTPGDFPSYMFFRNGPVLVSSTFQHQMMVSNTPVVLSFAQDKLFDVTRNRMVKSSALEVRPESPPLELPLRDFFTFDGNMYDIEPDAAARGLGLQLDKPLSKVSDDALLSFDARPDPAHVAVVASDTHLVVQQDRRKAVFRLFSRVDDAPPVVLDLTARTPACDRVVLTVASLLCFWHDGALSMLTKRSLKGSRGADPTVILPETLADVRVFSDNAAKLSLIYRDPRARYLATLEVAWDAATVARRFIGKAELRVDDLHVLDFFAELHSATSRVAVIVLDGHSNQLLFFYASTVTNAAEPMLKRAVPLTPLDNALGKLKCHRSSATDPKFLCMVFSAARLHLLRVELARADHVSLNLWRVTSARSFYNVLFATALDNTLNVRALGDSKNYFTFQKDIASAAEPLLVRYSLASPSARHSSFALPLKAYRDIVGVEAGAPRKPDQLADVQTVEVFHLDGAVLRRLVLRVGDYVLRHPRPVELDGKRLAFHSYFFNNPAPTDFAFSFAQKRAGADEAKAKRNIKIVLLVVGIILTAVCILVALFALLVLLRDRKKIQGGPAAAADETEVDISYM